MGGNRRVLVCGLGVILMTTGLAVPAAHAAAPKTMRVSFTSNGGQPNGNSYWSATSSDGRYVAFTSPASNLVPGDTNGRQDVFVRDRVAGTTSVGSVGANGKEGTSDSVQPDISADGRYVVFSSDSAELVPGDLSGQFDIFVRDRANATTRRLTVGLGGAEANGGSSEPVITPDGKYVAFISSASNLVPGDTNGVDDIFVVTVATGAIVRASVGVGGEANAQCFAAAISANGRYVAFATRASNLVSYDPRGFADVFVRDLQHNVTRRISQTASGTPGNEESGLNYVAMSADGRYVAFGSAASNLVPADTNGAWDVFVRDRTSGAVQRVSVGPGGAQANGNSGFLFTVSMSADGGYVAYSSIASNLVAGDTNASYDVFVRDRTAGVTTRVSVTKSGGQADSSNIDAAVSANGRSVVFTSFAGNMVAGDTNGYSDIYARDNF
jgi:Tol biopolymer transport system component